MNDTRVDELLEPAGDLALLDPGSILVEIVHSYLDALGDPAIHFFEVVERDGALVTIAGIRKERIPECEQDPDVTRRFRPIPGAFVSACRVCQEREMAEFERRGEPWPSFRKISDARWYAYDGTGPQHDRTSSAFEHEFVDITPTATLTACFTEDAQPYLRSCMATMLFIAPVDDDLRYLGGRVVRSSASPRSSVRT